MKTREKEPVTLRADVPPGEVFVREGEPFVAVDREAGGGQDLRLGGSGAYWHLDADGVLRYLRGDARVVRRPDAVLEY